MTGNITLITGANGFVGRALVEHLHQDRPVRAAVRRHDEAQVPGAEYCLIDSLGAGIDWSPLLAGIGAVVHTAARVHVMDERAADPLAAFRAVNVDGTLAFARQCAQAGVERFIFISSVKVNGETTEGRGPFTSHEPPHPVDPYGVSKWEAEQGLRVIERETGMAVVVIRPVLVYGPGVKANFRRLIQAVDKGLPLPLGRIDNLRSLVALDNLVSLIACCLGHPQASGQTFFASDGQDLSTTQLLCALGVALGRKPRLLSVPSAWLFQLGRLTGRQAEVARLLGSLRVDVGPNLRLLGWQAPFTVEQALVRTVANFRK